MARDDEQRSRKPYVRPSVVLTREIEALTSGCLTSGNDTGQDKLAFDPNTSTCLNPMT